MTLPRAWPPKQPDAMRWPERLYRVLLRCYPAEFRDEYASEMAQAFRDQASAAPPARLWRDLLTDLVVTAPREHAHVLMNDLRYTARMIRKAPAFTAAVVLTVALGIGANTAIFSFVYAEMLRALPFAEPQRLMQLAEKNDRLHLPNFGVSVLNYLSWSEQTQTFERLGAMGFASFNMSGRGDPELFTGSPISPSLVPLLDVKPVAGRVFHDGEDKPGSAPVVMISEGLWTRRFGREPSLVGRSLTLNGIDYTVVGIAPPALALLTGGDIWIPLTIDPGRENRLNHVIQVFGRLKPGVDVTQAQAEMDTVASRVGQQYPEVKDWGIHLLTMSDAFVGPQLRVGLLVLLGAVGCVLLIACANIANLLLARAASREKEIAIRTAMGASRSRLLRQLLAESVVLSMLGGGLGILGAVWAVRAINGALPPEPPARSRRRRRWDSPALRREHDRDHRRPVWHRAGVARSEGGCERDAEAERAHDRRIALAAAQRPGRGRARPGDRAAHRRRIARAEPARASARAAWLSARRSHDVSALAADGEVPGRERRGVLSRSARVAADRSGDP